MVYLLVLVILILSTTQTQKGFLVLVGTHPLGKCFISPSKIVTKNFRVKNFMYLMRKLKVHLGGLKERGNLKKQ
jgi:hypothetical protein